MDHEEFEIVEADDYEDMPPDLDAYNKRILETLGVKSYDDLPDGQSEVLKKYHSCLLAQLDLPCVVTGIEDFRWEEPYIFGGWSQKEYKQLKNTQPSYTDRYKLLSIEPEGFSQWMLCAGEDIGAHIKRLGDGKEFILGLSEL